MKIALGFLVLVSSLFFLGANLAAQEALPRLEAGGQWSWVIHYGKLRLGSLRLSSLGGEGDAGGLDRENQGRRARFSLQALSDPRLPIPPVDSRFESELDMERMRPLSFSSLARGGSELSSSRYVVDSLSGIARYESSQTKRGKTEREEGSLALGDTAYDGLSLILWMMSRGHREGRAEPSFVGDAKLLPLDIEFSGREEKLCIPGLLEEKSAYRVKGRLKGKGLAGLSGDFILWLSADESRIPLKAVLKLMIGEVQLDLVPTKPLMALN